MANNIPSDDASDNNARLAVTELDKAKAAKWFERAMEFGNLRKYDSAIEYFVNGLGFWPDAVEEGLRPLHGCGVALKQTGGKRPGLKDTMTRSMTGKDAKRALQNALWLFGHDPDKAGYVEGILRNANKLHCDDMIMWAAGVYRKMLDGDRKPNVKRFMLLRDIVEQASERAAERGEIPYAIAVLQLGVDALNGLARRVPRNREIETTVRDLSTKLTIVRGHYQDGDSFRDSLQDEESQKDIHDVDRLVQSDERQEALIAKAQADYEADPDQVGNLNKLIDMLCRRERADEEIRAIGILVNHFKQTGKYGSKQRADDIRIKQLKRALRTVKKAGDAKKTRDADTALLRFELKVYKDRHERYPTDLRVLFELGVRLYRGRQYDQAIPFLQRARNDPKNRDACSLYLGRCFYSKSLFDQAVDTLQDTITEREVADDIVGKELMYWLGRSQEAAGAQDDARKTFGHLLQMDYNYRDVRDRMEGLSEGGEPVTS